MSYSALNLLPSGTHCLFILFFFNGIYSPLLIRIYFLMIFYVTPYHPPRMLHSSLVQIWMNAMPSVWGNLVTQRLHKLPIVSKNQCHLIFLTIIIYVTQFNVNMITKVLLGPIAPLLQNLCLHLNLGNW